MSVNAHEAGVLGAALRPCAHPSTLNITYDHGIGLLSVKNGTPCLSP